MWQEQLDGIRELSKSIEQLYHRFDEDEISAGDKRDILTLLTCVLQPCGVDANILRNPPGTEIGGDEVGRLAKKIHEVFGAPGDWGYGTPIGDALRKIYGG